MDNDAWKEITHGVMLRSDETDLFATAMRRSVGFT
jgi:hypothetical protein